MLDVYDHIMAGIKNGRRGLPTCGINNSGRCPDTGLGQQSDFSFVITGECCDIELPYKKKPYIATSIDFEDDRRRTDYEFKEDHSCKNWNNKHKMRGAK
jgi:hypothetical protein